MSALRIVTCFLIISLAAAVSADETLTISGRVIDTDGNPVAGADVFFGNVWRGEYLNPEWWRYSDENGRFALQVPSDRLHNWMVVYAVSPEKERLAEARPELKEGVLEIPELTLTLKKALAIFGTVTDEAGAPVEGAIVGGTWDIPYPSVTKSDKDGNFRFAYPEDGQRTLNQVFAIHKELGMDYVETGEGRRRVADTLPENVKDGPFSLKLAKWQTFRIRVVDEHQTPLPGIEVYSWLPRKTDVPSINLGALPNRLFRVATDAQGIAEVPSISERMYYHADPPDEGILMPDGNRLFLINAYEFWTDLDKSNAIPTMKMKRRENVKGTVKLPDGTPVAWTMITISRHNACGHGLAWTNAKGEFNLNRPADELFDIGVESKLGATPGVFAFDTGDGIEEKRLDFVLEKGIRLHGTVYNPDGTPSEKYWILLHEKSPEDSPPLADGAETCPPGGCPVGVVIRQTSDHNEPNSGGKYEYILPAVPRRYDIFVSSNTNPDIFFELEDFRVNGDEEEIRLDFHLEVRER